ncbi:sensor histidine kinase [Janthinobacterium kumbetense]|uniref:Histidine kinase n=1 Tax=Janthinobacterium kumbetense TaxID=2950280 RepID=A0ABT0WQW3_9BURK|nr:histidine kinase [Janthinobacterium kumbetense]MCM2566363.1 histidine kinase [Janthinobacterium kumbetense]
MKTDAPSAAAPAAKARSPYYRMLPDARYALALNVICALVITFILNPGSHFGQNLIASMCIGTIAFLLIDGMRLTLWGEGQRPKFLPFMLIILISVPVAQMLGLTLFSWLTGVDVGGFENLLPTQMMGTLVFTLLATGGAVLFFSSREKIARLQMEAAQEKARAESVARQAMQAQLQLLQAQIEPHMLFNTLANLQGLISFDPERAQLLLDQLIQYLRATLSSSRAGSTTLEQEFSLMQAYLGLMSIRMGARLRFTLDLPDTLRQIKVPPMLLQPLVENAIQHGLEPKIEGGHIHVQASTDAGVLLLTVSDDGLGLDHPSQTKGTHLGVANIRERLRGMHGDAASLSLTANHPAGATARLTLPLPPTITSHLA